MLSPQVSFKVIILGLWTGFNSILYNFHKLLLVVSLELISVEHESEVHNVILFF
jgi:hypothetical protein